MTKKIEDTLPPDMSVTTRKVKVAVKNHPNDYKYPGSENREYGNAKLYFLDSLSEEEVTLYSMGVFIKDMDALEAFVTSVKEGDVVGVGHTKWVVKAVNGFNLEVYSSKTNTFDTTVIEAGELSVNLSIGYAEILYRDGKPFNTELEKEVTVKIIEKKKEG